MQVSHDTESVIDTDTAGRGIAGIDCRVLGIAHHYPVRPCLQQLFGNRVIALGHNVEWFLIPRLPFLFVGLLKRQSVYYPSK